MTGTISIKQAYFHQPKAFSRGTQTDTAGPMDTVTLSAEALNPYHGLAADVTTVTLDAWRQGANDSLEAALENQGYTLNEIYARDAGGKTLIDHVVRVNGLRNANLVKAGQQVVIPCQTMTSLNGRSRLRVTSTGMVTAI
jgi:hypothetical protein